MKLSLRITYIIKAMSLIISPQRMPHKSKIATSCHHNFNLEKTG